MPINELWEHPTTGTSRPESLKGGRNRHLFPFRVYHFPEPIFSSNQAYHGNLPDIHKER